MRSFAFMFAIVLLALPMAHAQKRADSTAHKLVRVTMPKSQYDEMMKITEQQVVMAMAQQMAQAGQPVDEEVLKKISTAVGKIYTYDELVEATAAIMVKHFSDADMKELLRFYATPVGKKSIEKMPEVMGDAMGWSMQVVNDRLPKVMESIMKPPAPEPKKK